MQRSARPVPNCNAIHTGSVIFPSADCLPVGLGTTPPQEELIAFRLGTFLESLTYLRKSSNYNMALIGDVEEATPIDSLGMFVTPKSGMYHDYDRHRGDVVFMIAVSLLLNRLLFLLLKRSASLTNSKAEGLQEESPVQTQPQNLVVIMDIYRPKGCVSLEQVSPHGDESFVAVWAPLRMEFYEPTCRGCLAGGSPVVRFLVCIRGCY